MLTDNSTPLEHHRVAGQDVLVKRDDLFARWPAPPLGKLRGALALLAKLHDRGVRLVGCWDTRISALGQGIAACALQFPGLRVIAAYPSLQELDVPEALRVAEELGAEVLPVRPGRITISFAAARKKVEARGGVMLPFGLESEESVNAIAVEAAFLPSRACDGGTVIVSCGSGVTLSGLIRGLGGRPKAFVGVSSGRSLLTIERCLRRHGASMDRVRLLPPEMSYAHPSRNSVPFPCHPNYDGKAWAYLEREIAGLSPPVLFWNVGAAGTGRPGDLTSKGHVETNGRSGMPYVVSGSSKPLSATGGKTVSRTIP